MAKLIYSAFTSLDGCIADEAGNFDWAELSDEVHALIKGRERQIGTYRAQIRCGRRTGTSGRATRDLEVGGPTLAAQTIRAGLPDERRFDKGLVYVRYRAKSW